ncbi:FkbM family methyltransferase [Chrysiogenes arsenatis]|uniref:FkbM family methyltransferase n=1 Tax=Chrysiogenes arsenatis TaxID=309797 RepID=UPI000413760C|nr:FkbM family methyltransferase [Chrysiogenes arsenatis]
MKQFLKYFLRSGSLTFTLARKGDGTIKVFTYKGKEIFYRSGTSDVRLIYEILLKTGTKAEYKPPFKLRPNVIFDIGANIGLSSIYFANCFPNSRIYAFEPSRQNYELLVNNTKNYPNISAHCLGFGSADGETTFYLSDDATNFGGGSIHSLGIDIAKQETVKIAKPSTFLKEIENQKIDIIKIDTEGAEYDIITSFPNDVLNSVTWITGELHGINDFKLLDYLSTTFSIQVNTKLFKRLSRFDAFNKNATKETLEGN